jgi:hypothetical protein
MRWLVLFSGLGDGGSLSSNSTSCSISLSHLKIPQHSTILHFERYSVLIIANNKPIPDVTSKVKNISDNTCIISICLFLFFIYLGKVLTLSNILEKSLQKASGFLKAYL